MRSKFFLMATLLFSSLNLLADWHPETITYEVKEKTRFYRADSVNKKKKMGIYLSFVVRQGMTLDGCDSIIEGFLEGKECGQAEFPSFYGLMEKDGKKRKLMIDVAGGAMDVDKHPEYATAEKRKATFLADSTQKYRRSEEILKSDDFSVEGHETGRFAIRKNGSRYEKIVKFADAKIPCILVGFYSEKDEKGEKDIPYSEWLFEDVFDSVVRELRCEAVPTAYTKKWNEERIKKEKKAGKK